MLALSLPICSAWGKGETRKTGDTRQGIPLAPTSAPSQRYAGMDSCSKSGSFLPGYSKLSLYLMNNHLQPMNHSRLVMRLVCVLAFFCFALPHQAAGAGHRHGVKKHHHIMSSKAAKKHQSGVHILARHGTKKSRRIVSSHRRRQGTHVSGIEGQLSARSAIIIDASSGATLYARSPDALRQPASTIKVVTAMIALATLRAGDTVPVSSYAAGQPASKVYLDEDSVYSANDLINAVLMASANDASVALAEKIAGSESAFAQRMTGVAHRWGASQTVCKTATGLTAPGQATTARDLATIFRYAMENPVFAARMKQVNVKTSFGKLLRSHNRALWQVQGSIGGKTGFTNAARQTYVGKFKRGDRAIIVAIMGSETMWNDLKRLVEFGFAKERSHQLAGAGD